MIDMAEETAGFTGVFDEDNLGRRAFGPIPKEKSQKPLFQLVSSRILPGKSSARSSLFPSASVVWKAFTRNSTWSPTTGST